MKLVRLFPIVHVGDEWDQMRIGVGSYRGRAALIMCNTDQQLARTFSVPRERNGSSSLNNDILRRAEVE